METFITLTGATAQTTLPSFTAAGVREIERSKLDIATERPLKWGSFERGSLDTELAKLLNPSSLLTTDKAVVLTNVDSFEIREAGNRSFKFGGGSLMTIKASGPQLILSCEGCFATFPMKIPKDTLVNALKGGRARVYHHERLELFLPNEKKSTWDPTMVTIKTRPDSEAFAYEAMSKVSKEKEVKLW